MSDKKRRTPRRDKASNFPVLIQTRVSDELAKRIEKAARAETLSTSSYVRRLLSNQVPGGM